MVRTFIGRRVFILSRQKTSYLRKLNLDAGETFSVSGLVLGGLAVQYPCGGALEDSGELADVPVRQDLSGFVALQASGRYSGKFG